MKIKEAVHNLKEACKLASIECKKVTDAMLRLQNTNYTKPKSKFHN
jgi:hypothetical protein